MKAELIKRCFRAMTDVAEKDYSELCSTVIREERELGHTMLAQDLQKLMEAARTRTVARPVPALRRLTSLPSPSGTELFVERMETSQLRHTMVLDEPIEGRFRQIEREFAARDRLARHGLGYRRRVLIYGPPGCGKTLGAERLAWNTGLPLIRVRFDALISSYYGETATNLRRVFDLAAKEPCLLLLDECDYIAKKRSDNRDVGEASRVVNSLLHLLEDFKAPGLLVATTNLDEMLDHAIFRRFDDVFAMRLPGKKETVKILQLALSGIKTDKHLFLDAIADELHGLSAATVVQLAHDAAKHVVLEGRDVVRHDDVAAAVARVYKTRKQGS